MAEHVFVDTSFLLALVNSQDENHAPASQIRASIFNQVPKASLIFTDFIFDETMTVMKCRGVPMDIIGRTGDMLLNSKYISMIMISEPTFRAAWSMMKQRADKGWSFTDCTSFSVMEELGISRHLSFDAHFDQAGFHAWAP